MFNDSGDIRTPKNKADLKNAISVVSSALVEETSRVVVVDGCAFFLWNTLWRIKGSINDLMRNYIERILMLLKERVMFIW